MKHRGTKILSLLLTLVLVLGLMPGMGLTAYAAEVESEEFTTNTGNGTYTGTHIKITGTGYVDGDGAAITPWTIQGLSGETITRVDMTIGWYGGNGYVSHYSANHGTLSNINDSNGGGFSFIDVNSTSITIECDDNQYLYQIKKVVVYYSAGSSSVAVTGVTLNPSTAQTINVDGKVSFTATVSPDNATDKTVKWSVGGTNASAVKLYSDADCKTAVQLNTATETTTVYAKGMSAGSATVTVTATNGTDDTADDKSASCAVTVNGYTVRFDPNGGDGQMEDVPNVLGEYTLPGCDFDPPAGQSFKAWSLDGTEYAPGATINIGRNTTFVAVWQAAASGGAVGFGGGDESWSGGYVTGLRAYRVSLAPMQGGSASLVLNTGESGESMNVYPQTTVRVVPSPAPGYKLASIVWSLIDGSASYDITQSQTFVMPAMDAVVHVTFVPVG